MPESIFSGVQAARYQDAGGDWSLATVLDKVKADSESNPEQPGDDVLGTGDVLFAGENRQETLRIYNISEFDALRTKMLADGKIDLQIQDMEGNWNDVALNFIPRVRKPNNYATGNRRFFELEVNKFVIS